MDDRGIITLYNRRDQRAITETSAKYGGYCLSIARNILWNMQDCEECVNDTWLHAWNAIPLHSPTVSSCFWQRSPATCLLTATRPGGL